MSAIFDEDRPHDPRTDRAQREALLRLLGDTPARVLDLGCGGGRLAAPLVRAGHDVVGVDRDAAALARCRARCRKHAADGPGGLDLVERDFARGPLPEGPFHAVLCLGNTFMTFTDVDEAVDLLRRAASALGPGGSIAIDDVPGACWPELTEGNWRSGVSEDGRMQLVWEASDAVFVLRRGAEVRPDDWQVRDGERRLRLWTDGALRLAAAAAGLTPPERIAGACLLVMRPRGGGRGRPPS